jgi:hypothetical protein
MIRFDVPSDKRCLVVNWTEQASDPTDCMELLIAPRDLTMTVNAKGIATWPEEDVAEIPATCVYNGGFVAALRALDQGHLTSATLAVVTGCESQLSMEATGVNGEVRLIIRDLYPPHRSATIELPVAELLSTLFPSLG